MRERDTHQRWLRFAHWDAPVGRVVVLEGVIYTHTGRNRWNRRSEFERLPDAGVQTQATRRTMDALKKRNAAPDWDDYIHEFGAQGIQYDDAGQIVGYTMPTPRSDEDRRRINETVYEMWNPQRRIAVEMGSEVNAAIPTATLVDRDSGKEQVLPAAVAERKARKSGLIEKPTYHGKKKRR